MARRTDEFVRLATPVDDNDLEWMEDVDEYGWFLDTGSGGKPDRIPDLAWVWDLGALDILDLRLAVASRQPFGNA